jgi:TolB-like protein
VVHDASITHLTAKRLDVFTIGLIVVAFAFILADRFWLSPLHVDQSAPPAAVVTDTVQTAGSEPAEPQYPPNSIAVLPFVNMSDDATNEYFSDGISEELLNLLAKIPELRVIARTSSFAYKGKDVNIADIADELNVGHILEGSVRKAGNQVRITAQLIRASDSSHLWSETYDRTLDNIFAIQDEIAAAVVEHLKITLLGETPKAHVVDPEAYALFLQAIRRPTSFCSRRLSSTLVIRRRGLNWASTTGTKSDWAWSARKRFIHWYWRPRTRHSNSIPEMPQPTAAWAGTG